MVGGKASGLLALSGLGLPIPRTTIVANLPGRFPELGSEKVIIRPSEIGDSARDAIAAQSFSGVFESPIADVNSWSKWHEDYSSEINSEIASYVLQPYLDIRLGVMGHSWVRTGQTFIAVASSLTELSEGKQASFEAVLEMPTRYIFTRSPVISDSFFMLVDKVSYCLPRLLEWPFSEVIEWEAALQNNDLYFLQCQASTAENPGWSR